MPVNTLVARKKPKAPSRTKPAPKRKGTTKSAFKDPKTGKILKKYIKSKSKSDRKRVDYVGGKKTGKADKGKRLNDMIAKYENLAGSGGPQSSQIVLNFKLRGGKISVSCENKK